MVVLDDEHDVEFDKNVVRKRMRSFRNALGADLRARTDSAICDRLVATEEFQQADTVFSYLSFGSEVDTRELIGLAWDAGKTVALPRVEDGHYTMGWYIVESFDGLKRSSMGVEEPDPEPERLIDPAGCERPVAIVPGLAFDMSCYRLGYGGGYYDAFLSTFTGTPIGLCRECQFIGSLKALGIQEEHDKPVRFVVTEDRIVRA